MLTFRTEDESADRATEWAERLGVDRSELIRTALRKHLSSLEAVRNTDAWQAAPPTDDETAIDKTGDWGPAENWSSWR